MRAIVCTVLLFSVSPVLPQVTRKVGGPYDIVFMGAGECDDVGDHKVILNFEAKQKSKTIFHIKGNGSTPYGWSDLINAYVVVSSLYKNRKIKSEFLRKDFGGACTAVKLFAPDLARTIFKAIGNYTDCPTKPGNYSLELDTQIKLAGLPVAIYDPYRIEIQLHVKSRKVGCLYFEVEFTPKKVQKRRG